MKKLFLAGISFAVIGCAYGAETEKAEEKEPFFEFVKEYGIIIRKGLENKNFVKDPAAISWSSPKDGASSTAIDIGIGVQAWSDSTKVVMPKVEYHKNTETDSEQDAFKLGIIYSQSFPTKGKQWTNFVEIAANFKNDRIKNGEGWTSGVSYTPTYAPLHLGYTGLGDVAWMFTPWIAAQSEHANNLAVGEPSGYVLRTKGSLDLAIYPANRTLKKNLEFLVGYQHWVNHSRRGPFRLYDREQSLFSASLNYYFDKKQTFGIGLDYTDGENPEDNRAKQVLTALTLKLKIGD